MKLVFWNTNRKNLSSEFADLIIEHDVDFAVAAEWEHGDRDLLNVLGGPRGWYKVVTNQVNGLLVCYSNSIGDVQQVDDRSRMTGWMLDYAEHGRWLLVAVHLASKMWRRAEDKFVESIVLVSHIERLESLHDIGRTIVIGDFNMDPFESGMVMAKGLHGIMDRSIVARRSRVVDRETRRFFYNPM